VQHPALLKFFRHDGSHIYLLHLSLIERGSSGRPAVVIAALEAQRSQRTRKIPQRFAG
jgi:hypothetical protein